jgi:transposase
MSNVLDDNKQQQILALGRLGWSLRRIEQALAVRRETISGYLKAAGIVVRGRGRRSESKAKPAISAEVSTDSGPPNPATRAAVSTDPAAPIHPGRAPSASACEPYREIIADALARGRNAVAIWQDLVDDHGFPARYASVRRFVVTLRGSAPTDARVVITTAPGEEGQVDYGDGPMVRDRGTGQYRRPRLFVLTLGCSRKSVRLLVWRSSAQIWAELHERAFRRLGGTVRVIVLDNLREGVLTPDIYDPSLNPLYRDVLAHYGVIALPCRVGDPDRKGKVAAGVGHAQKTPLRGLRFESLEAAQAYLDRWEARWADTRIHGTTKRQVAAMFAEEQPTLGPLPLEPFRYYRYGERTVHLVAASKSRPRTTVRRRAGSGGVCRCNGMICTSGCWRRTPGSACASISGLHAAGIASTTTIGRRGRRPARSRSSLGRRPPVCISAPSATTSISTKARRAFDACSVCSPWRRNTARRSSTTRPKPRLISACPPTAFCVGTSNVGCRCR